MSVSRAARIATSAGLAGWGAALLVAPAAVVRSVGAGPLPPEPVVRVLGGRRVVQHLLVAATSSRLVAWASVGTDVLHAASMVAAARAWPQYRRPALTSAAVAGVAAALTALTASAGSPGSR